MTRTYRDGTDLDGLPTPAVIPTSDAEGNPLEFEYGLSVFKDFQVLYIQEMPEHAPAGQMPRSVCVILQDDLVDSVKPGDRVQVVGVFRPLGRSGKLVFISKDTFKTALVANNVQKLDAELLIPEVTEKDEQNIKQIASDPQVFEILSNSIAPSIWGHSYIKKAVLLLLLGGTEVALRGGTKIRGDINILLIGDPGTAKSQILRFVMSIAPLSVSTTGRGSTGVGLTAAVTNDPDTGGRKLEAGAMVLADRGIVCIDEFDKLNNIDRVAIHEVMEQQTVTIAKAGLHLTLNARCSVVAAANPVFSRYNRLKSPQENIALPHSLLSRFDLMFIVLDNLDPDRDRKISSHILKMHQFHDPSTTGDPLFAHEQQETLLSTIQRETEEINTEEVPVFEGTDSLYSNSDTDEFNSRSRRRRHNSKRLVTLRFLRMFVDYCKSKIHPVLTEEASTAISQEYVLLRTHADGLLMPVTVRTLETLVRLSTAHAKLRLSKTVTIDDVEAIKVLLRFTLLCGGTYEAASHSSIGLNIDLDIDNLGSADFFDRQNSRGHRRRRTRIESDDEDDAKVVTPSSSSGQTTQGPLILSDYESTSEAQQLSELISSQTITETAPVPSGRRQDFHTRVLAVFDSLNTDQVPLTDLISRINAHNPSPFSQNEVQTLLSQLQQNHTLMVSQDIVYLLIQ